MTETTYRTRAQGPGWSQDDIFSRYLSMTHGNERVALRLACHDLAEMMMGGLLRPPPMDGPADINIEKPKAIT